MNKLFATTNTTAVNALLGGDGNDNLSGDTNDNSTAAQAPMWPTQPGGILAQRSFADLERGLARCSTSSAMIGSGLISL
jgi:hypothetical protein